MFNKVPVKESKTWKKREVWSNGTSLVSWNDWCCDNEECTNLPGYGLSGREKGAFGSCTQGKVALPCVMQNYWTIDITCVHVF